MQPPPPPPPGLPRRQQGGCEQHCTQAAAAPGDVASAAAPGSSQKRPYWRNKNKGQGSSAAAPQPPPNGRGHSNPSAAHTPPPPPPSGGRGVQGGGGGGGGRHARASAAAGSTPISVPRQQRQQQGFPHGSSSNGGGSNSGSWGAGGGGGGSAGWGTPPSVHSRTPMRSQGRGPNTGGSSGFGGSGMSSARKGSGRRGTYYTDHLPGPVLQQGLKSGWLFRAAFRTNPSERAQGYCTLPGLPTDVFIRGLKLQNRAVEGDEVAIRILPPSDWYQLSSSKAAAEAAATAGGGTPPMATPTRQAGSGGGTARSNVVPLASRLSGSTSAVPPTPLTAAVGAGPGAMTPPAWAGQQEERQRRPMGDLLASPALMPSASGGDLGTALGPTPLHAGAHAVPAAVLPASQAAQDSEDEDSEAGSVSSEGGLSEEEADAMLALAEDEMVGLQLDSDVAGMMAAAGEGRQQGAAAAAAAAGQEAGEEESAVVEAAGKETTAVQDGVQEGGRLEEEEAESMADFLVRNRDQLAATPPTAGALSAAAATPPTAAAGPQAAAAVAAGSAASVSSLGPSAAQRGGGGGSGGAADSGGAGACWHPVGQPQEALQHIAQLLGQMEGWRVTGEVVAVLEASRRRESVVGVLKQEGEKDTGTFFLIPCDPRLPRMMVRSATLPPNIKQALKQEAQTAELAARTLVSGRVTTWEAQYPFPLAQVRSSLGQAGGLASETAALLAMEQVQDDDQFTPEVLSCLPPTPWSISEEELGRRRDFRSHRVFSIDPPTARDLDDALSVEELSDGGYRVGVHIADVSHFVQPGSALDREAQQRSTSVYLVDRVIPMLPRLLCEELCSLNPGVDRLAFSVVWDMSPDGDIRSTWAGRSVIRSCGKLAYPMVQQMIEGSYLALEGQEPPCQLWDGHTWPDVVRDSLTLHRIASSLRKQRYDNGALRLDNTRLYFKLDGEGNPQDYGVYEQREANQLVEEFMLLANMTTAAMVAQHFPDRALLRCHPPPNMHKMLELSTTAAELGFNLDTSGAGPLQRSLAALRQGTVDPAALEVLTLLATKPMQNARYFCTGETPDESFWRHFALAVTHYTHFTSPIRRYPDIIVHRLMAALLDEQGSQQQRIQRHELYGTREVGVIAAHANDRKLAAKSVQDGSLRLYLCVMLHRQPLVCDAVIMQLGGSRFFDAYIPALGCDVRIHTNSLLAGGDAAIDPRWQPEDKSLVLQHATAAAEQRGEQDLPDYSDIPNLAAVRNPCGIAPVELPLMLRMLTHVPILVSSRRSQTSGSPTHVTAKLWLAPVPVPGQAAASASGGQQQQQGVGLAGAAPAVGAGQGAGGLREALAQGIQENWD